MNVAKLKRMAAVCVLALGLPSWLAAAAPNVVADSVRTQYEQIRVVQLAAGLERPWGLAFLPDGAFLVTERPGRLQLVRDGRKTEVTGLPEISAIRQGGLLDVSLHPDFADNR
jgi:glucose/arabinose dehydrogenase